MISDLRDNTTFFFLLLKYRPKEIRAGHLDSPVYDAIAHRPSNAGTEVSIVDLFPEIFISLSQTQRYHGLMLQIGGKRG